MVNQTQLRTTTKILVFFTNEKTVLKSVHPFESCHRPADHKHTQKDVEVKLITPLFLLILIVSNSYFFHYLKRYRKHVKIDVFRTNLSVIIYFASINTAVNTGRSGLLHYLGILKVTPKSSFVLIVKNINCGHIFKSLL